MRIMVPFWFWGFVCWLFFGRLILRDLVTQLTLSYPSCRPLYFMPILALITVIIFCVQKEKRCSLILCTLLIFSWAMQYSGLNIVLFSPLGKIDAGCVIGRFVELLPMAIIALFFKRYIVSNSIVPKRIVLMGFCCCLMGILLWLVPWIRHVEGFGYCGIAPELLSTGICLMAIGAGELLKDAEKITKWAHWLGAISVGIYLTHIFSAKIVLVVCPMSKSALLFFACLIVSIAITSVLKSMRVTKIFVS